MRKRVSHREVELIRENIMLKDRLRVCMATMEDAEKRSKQAVEAAQNDARVNLITGIGDIMKAAARAIEESRA